MPNIIPMQPASPSPLAAALSQLQPLLQTWLNAEVEKYTKPQPMAPIPQNIPPNPAQPIAPHVPALGTGPTMSPNTPAGSGDMTSYLELLKYFGLPGGLR